MNNFFGEMHNVREELPAESGKYLLVEMLKGKPADFAIITDFSKKYQCFNASDDCTEGSVLCTRFKFNDSVDAYWAAVLPREGR